jgi:transcriptional regulator with XRE-family HTH domain
MTLRCASSNYRGGNGVPSPGTIRLVAVVAERTTVTDVAVGDLLRLWRRRRGLSQLQLSFVAAISARHLSFIETGRAHPSREMTLHLAERLQLPLRERNHLLLAAGYAPVYRARSLADQEMAPARQAIERFLRAHEPYPALILDEHWNLVVANAAMARLTDGVAPELLEPPANILRVALHPEGMAPFTVNFSEWSSRILHRLRERASLSADAKLELLYEELRAYPNVTEQLPAAVAATEILLPLRLQRGEEELAFLSTITKFETATDITLAGLALEAFYPADQETAKALLRDSSS